MIWGYSRVRTLHAVVIAAVIAAVLVATLAATEGPAHAAPPANDDFADAEAIAGSPVEVTGTLVDATVEDGEADVMEFPVERTVWYSWTAPEDARFILDVVNGDFIGFTVFTGDALSSLTVEARGGGRVVFDAVAGVRYSIAVDGVDPVPFQIELARSASIEGAVVDDAGAGISGVRVRPCRDGRPCYSPTATTDSEGRYRLWDVLPGAYQVHFEPDGVHVEEWFGDSLDRDTATDVVVEAEDRLRIDAQLAVGRTISGRVTGPGGDSAGTSVWACRWSHEHDRCINAGSNGARIAADGTYTVDALPPGDFKVRFWSAEEYINEWYDDIPERFGQDGERVRAEIVSVPADDDVTGIDAQLLRYSSLSGRVVNRIGEGQDARVHAYRLDDEGRRSHARSTSTDEDGRYLLDRMESADYKIEFELLRSTRWYDDAADSASATVVSLPESTDLKGLDLTLHPSRSISGVVTDAEGNGVEGVLVIACEFDARPCGVYTHSTSDHTNADGAYLITPPAGTYSVRANPGPSYLDRWYEDAVTWETAAPVTVDDETPHVVADVQVTAPGTIAGTVTDSTGAGLEDVTVKACREPVAGSDRSCSQVAYAATDSSGGYTVDDVAEGRYIVEFRPDRPHLSEAYDNHLIDWVRGVDTVPSTWIEVGSSEDVTAVDAELLTREEWEANAVTPTCRGRDATIVGTAGDDDLVGTAGPDVIVALAGRDTIRGLGGDDIICAGGGGDRVLAGPGDDVLVGGPGWDELGGRRGNDRLSGGAGRDVLAGGPGRDVLKGRRGADRLLGGAHRDWLHGGPWRDRCNGGGGSDGARACEVRFRIP